MGKRNIGFVLEILVPVVLLIPSALKAADMTCSTDADCIKSSPGYMCSPTLKVCVQKVCTTTDDCKAAYGANYSCVTGRDKKNYCCQKDKNETAIRTTCKPKTYCVTDSDCTKSGFGKCAADANGKINYCCKSYWPVNKDNCEPDPIVCTTSSDCPDDYKCVTGKDGKKYCCNGPISANTCKPAAYCAVDVDCPTGFKHCIKGTGVNSGLNFCCKKSTSPLTKENCKPNPKSGACTQNSHCTTSGYGKCCATDDGNKCCKTCDCGGVWQKACSCK